MKKTKNFIKNLSLVRQLLALIASMLVFLIVFFFGVFSFNVDTFVQNQMFGLMHTTQDIITENYLLGRTGTGLFGNYDANMIHVLREEGKVPVVSNANAIEENAPNIYSKIEELFLTMSVGDRMDMINYGPSKSLVSTFKINESTSVTTILPQDYSNEFKSTLLNSVVYILVIVIGIVFLSLLFWVGNLIRRLNQIKYYIAKSRENEEVVLKIERGDEIGEVANALVQMREELKRQERQKEEMLQNISHDLKTPVATIKSYSEAIKDGIYPYQTLEKSVDVIIEHATRLENKVYNLLMLNRMDYMTHQAIDTHVVLDLEPIIEDVIVSSSQIRPEISIEVDVDGSKFVGQEEPWRVVIENILDNALRYSKSRILITVRDDYLSIFNDGEAVSDDKIRSFFNAYEMGEKGQFGLGLAIVSRVVTNYHYTVDAMNAEGGVVFVISKGGNKNEFK